MNMRIFTQKQRMQYLFVSLLVCLMLPLSVAAQKLKVVSFEKAGFDKTAFTQPRIDYAENYCAIVKVRFPKEGATFEGMVFEDPLFKTNEYWVYMNKGAKHLECHFPGYETLDVEFIEYDSIRIEPKTVYILTLKGEEKKGLEAIEKGDAASLLELARNYEKGIRGFTKDLNQAKIWYEKAAKAGSIEAQEYLAEVCFEGKNGFQQDYYDAFQWHKACAERGRVDSYYPLGQLYAEGKGTTVNKNEAIRWLTKYNDERNHPEAQLLLANLLGKNNGQGVAYYKKAADNGIAEAMYKYAEAIKYKDKENSDRYFYKAALKGYPPKKVVAVEERTVPTANPSTTERSEKASSSDDYSWLSQRRVTESDLRGKSKAELRILRNAIYARHGYKFKSADLMSYFKRFSWYHPQSSDVSAQLSSLEQSNVQFIKSYE